MKTPTTLCILVWILPKLNKEKLKEVKHEGQCLHEYKKIYSSKTVIEEKEYV